MSLENLDRNYITVFEILKHLELNLLLIAWLSDLMAFYMYMVQLSSHATILFWERFMLHQFYQKVNLKINFA